MLQLIAKGTGSSQLGKGGSRPTALVVGSSFSPLKAARAKLASPTSLERIEELPENVGEPEWQGAASLVNGVTSQPREQAPGRGLQAASGQTVAVKYDPFRLTRSPLTTKRTDDAEAKVGNGKNSTYGNLRATKGGRIVRSKIDKGKAAKTKTADPRLLKNGIRMDRVQLKKLSVRSSAEERVKMTNLRYRRASAQTNKPKKKEDRGRKWTEKSMIFQIIMVFLAIFIVYFGGHAAALYVYTSAFIGITEEYIDSQVQTQADRNCQDVLNSISNSVTGKFELERQQIAQAKVILEPLLDDGGPESTFQIKTSPQLEHVVDGKAIAAQVKSTGLCPGLLNQGQRCWSSCGGAGPCSHCGTGKCCEAAGKGKAGNEDGCSTSEGAPSAYTCVASTNCDRQVDEIGYFLTPTYASSNFWVQDAKKIGSLSNEDASIDWWHQTLRHPVRDFRSQQSEHSQYRLFLDLKSRTQAAQAVYEYPVQIDNTNMLQGLAKGMWEIDDICFEAASVTVSPQVTGDYGARYLAEELINYSGYDIAQGKRRVSKIAIPIKIEDKINGVMIWEEDLAYKFNKSIIPESYFTHQYPFIQVRLPQDPRFLSKEDQAMVSSGHYPRQNVEYSETKPAEQWVSIEDLKPAGQPQEGKVAGASIEANDEAASSYPLGEILYEQNTLHDPRLKDINKHPAYIKFVNDMQAQAFTDSRSGGGSSSADGATWNGQVGLDQSGVSDSNVHSEDLNVTYKLANGTTAVKAYKIFAQSLRVEDVDEATKAKIEGLEYPSKHRRSSEYNVIIFIIMDKDISEELVKAATSIFLNTEVNRVKWMIIGIGLCTTLLMGFIILLLVQAFVVHPISELSQKMSKQQDKAKMDQFVKKIQKTAEKHERERGKGAVTRLPKLRGFRTGKLTHTPSNNQDFVSEDSEDEREYIDEVEQLRVLFSQFFLQYSKSLRDKEINAKLRKLDSKDVLLSADQKKKEALLQKFAGSKVVMMMHEDSSKNQMLQSYQKQHVQHMKSFERLLEVERQECASKFYPRREGNHDWNIGTDSQGEVSQKENVVDPHDVILELTSDSLSDLSEKELLGAPGVTGRSDHGTGTFQMEEMLMSNRTPGADRPQPVGLQQVRKSMRDKERYMKGAAGSQQDHHQLNLMPRGRSGPDQERGLNVGHAPSNAAPFRDLFDRRKSKSPFGSARKQTQPQATQKPIGAQLVHVNRSNLDSGVGEASDGSMEVDSSGHQDPRKPTCTSVVETLEAARAPSKRLVPTSMKSRRL